MKKAKSKASVGPTQRQLRAGELVRHAVVEILQRDELFDEAVAGKPVTVSEVKMSPDLKHALVFVEPLGGDHSDEIIKGLNRCAKFLRGRLGKSIEMKFTPALKFVHDDRYDAAQKLDALFRSEIVQRDLASAGEDDGENPQSHGA